MGAGESQICKKIKLKAANRLKITGNNRKIALNIRVNAKKPGAISGRASYTAFSDCAF
jgi:hypothetical protein